MKIIEPSATILQDDPSVYLQIENRAAVCYQRPPRTTEEEAKVFCQKMIDSGHSATLEMAVVHLVVEIPGAFSKIDGKYLMTESTHPLLGYAVVTGSIRAFMEYDGLLSEHIQSFLSALCPIFFKLPTRFDRVRFARREEIPDDHKHVAVRFIIGRQTSHEIVRHRPCSYLQESQRFCGYNQNRFDGQVTFIKPWFADNNRLYPLWEQAMLDAELKYQNLITRGATPQEARTVLPNSTKTEIIVYASNRQWRHIFALRTTKACDPSMLQVMVPLREEMGL